MPNNCSELSFGHSCGRRQSSIVWQSAGKTDLFQKGQGPIRRSRPWTEVSFLGWFALNKYGTGLDWFYSIYRGHLFFQTATYAWKRIYVCKGGGPFQDFQFGMASLPVGAFDSTPRCQVTDVCVCVCVCASRNVTVRVCDLHCPFCELHLIDHIPDLRVVHLWAHLPVWQPYGCVFCEGALC